MCLFPIIKIVRMVRVSLRVTSNLPSTSGIHKMLKARQLSGSISRGDARRTIVFRIPNQASKDEDEEETDQEMQGTPESRSESGSLKTFKDITSVKDTKAPRTSISERLFSEEATMSHSRSNNVGSGELEEDEEAEKTETFLDGEDNKVIKPHKILRANSGEPRILKRIVPNLVFNIDETDSEDYSVIEDEHKRKPDSLDIAQNQESQENVNPGTPKGIN